MEANNMAAMRDALKQALYFLRRHHTGAVYATDGETLIFCDDVANIVDNALSVPPRECDRFTDEKQADALHAAFIEHCNRCDCPMGCDHRKNPRFLLDGNCASILKCFARFALSKATPKEGGDR